MDYKETILKVKKHFFKEANMRPALTEVEQAEYKLQQIRGEMNKNDPDFGYIKEKIDKLRKSVDIIESRAKTALSR